MTIHPRDLTPESVPSPTAHVIRDMQLHGYRVSKDEPDPRPLPGDETMRGALDDMFDILVTTLTDTLLEPDLEDLLWSTVRRHVCSASSTATMTRNAEARPNRTALKSDRSNSNALSSSEQV